MSEPKPNPESVGGVPASEITIPFNIRMTCVGCEANRPFDPVARDGSVITYECEDCGHRALLDINQ